MNKTIFTFLSAACALMTCLSAEEGVCHRCEEIREANKHKVNPYVYYDDYLKAHPEEQNKLQKNEKVEEHPEKNPESRIQNPE
jgi:hypothetical protein